LSRIAGSDRYPTTAVAMRSAWCARYAATAVFAHSQRIASESTPRTMRRGKPQPHSWRGSWWRSTTTPRPTKLIRELLAREGRDVTVTRGSSYENRANLAPGFFDQIIGKYEGTRLGRQELEAELFEDTPGALWNRERLGEARWPTHRGRTRTRKRRSFSLADAAPRLRATCAGL